MPNIRITKEVRAIVRSHAEYDWKETGIQLPNGDWEVPISDKTLKKLIQKQLFGESINDCILRLFYGRVS